MSATAITLPLMAVTVITGTLMAMARWEPDAKGRLGRAALKLFAERGYDQTTVADIAEGAGLTERTFFRHFVDKRDVLFSGSKELQELLVSEVAGAPLKRSPLEAIVAAFVKAADTVFEERRDFSTRRQAVIGANPELHERESIKLATLASALAQALRGRGVQEPTASLAAEAGVAVFKIGFQRWISAPGGRTLAALIRDSAGQLGALTRSSHQARRYKRLPAGGVPGLTPGRT